MTIAMSAADLADVRAVLRDCTGVVLTDDALRELVADDLAAQVSSWGASDTVVREGLCDGLARTLTGRGFPTYGERLSEAAVDVFFADLASAAHERGWAVPAPSLT